MKKSATSQTPRLVHAAQERRRRLEKCRSCKSFYGERNGNASTVASVPARRILGVIYPNRLCKIIYALTTVFSSRLRSTNYFKTPQKRRRKSYRNFHPNHLLSCQNDHPTCLGKETGPSEQWHLSRKVAPWGRRSPSKLVHKGRGEKKKGIDVWENRIRRQAKEEKEEEEEVPQVGPLEPCK